VGTGPFRLAQWRRSSRIVLERNPRYREVRYDAQPAADDEEGQAHRWRAARAAGCRWSTAWRSRVIEEAQPRWLAFLNGDIDFAERARRVRRPWAMPSGRAGAQPAARRGVRALPRD
jgi:ABC-type transport system substrate-binding protein